MDVASVRIIQACVMILEEIRNHQAELLDIAEDTEKKNLREIVYDLDQANSLLNRATTR